MKDHKKARMCETCENFQIQDGEAYCTQGKYMHRFLGKDRDYYHAVANCKKYAQDLFSVGGFLS
jgi:hypothetical protein